MSWKDFHGWKRRVNSILVFELKQWNGWWKQSYYQWIREDSLYEALVSYRKGVYPVDMFPLQTNCSENIHKETKTETASYYQYFSNITLLLITTTRPWADSPWGERKAILILKDSDGICHSNEQYKTPRVYLSYKSIGTHSSTLALL